MFDTILQNLSVKIADDKTIAFTASFGVATADIANNCDVESVINKADNALYRAKRLGRNRVEAEV